MDKTKLIMGIALVVCIIGIAGYLMVGYYKDNLNAAQIEAYNLGASDAVTYIMSETSQCKQLPLTISNVTLNLIAVECLQQS